MPKQDRASIKEHFVEFDPVSENNSISMLCQIKLKCIASRDENNDIFCLFAVYYITQLSYKAKLLKGLKGV
jgi:hypothetical protein